MARQARGKSMDPAKVQVFHTLQRCVRRAFLCGEDAVSGKSYDHRKQWIRERLEFLASIFAIDLLTYTVMSNNLHLVMRSRPDVVAAWSNQEVVARYWEGQRHTRVCRGQLAGVREESQDNRHSK